MTHRILRLVLLAVCAAGLLPVAAQAQWYGERSAPLYPYQVQPGQGYAVEVAPGTYVFHRSRTREYPYVRTTTRHHVARRHTTRRYSRERYDSWRRSAHRYQQPSKHSRSVRSERLRRSHGQRIVINTRKVVREKPVVIVHRRVVNDRPRVIERRHYVEDVPAPPRRAHRKSKAAHSTPRVIHAEAEVTILGPDRMSIRLYRKRGNGNVAFDKK